MNEIKTTSKTWLTSKLRRQTEVCLLLDNSGSMACHVEGTCRRIDVLRDVASRFQLRKFVFNSTVEERWDIPEPTGSTDMASAFLYCKDRGIKKIVLITDGDPDSQSWALECAVGLEIDIIFIGTNRPKFLDDLAKLTGGKVQSSDFKPDEVGAIESSITALIEGRTENVIPTE